jgi:hypothetical protein
MLTSRELRLGRKGMAISRHMASLSSWSTTESTWEISKAVEREEKEKERR